jgi:hypothetical protein
MPSLIKKNSMNPSTIVTKFFKPNSILIKPELRFIDVPQIEIDSIKFDHLDAFDLPIVSLKHLEKKK